MLKQYRNVITKRCWLTWMVRIMKEKLKTGQSVYQLFLIVDSGMDIIWDRNLENGSRATKRKIYIGKVTNYFTKIKVAEILIESYDLKIGDEILITGPTTGVVQLVVNEIRVDLKETSLAPKGVRCSIPIDTLIRRSDKVYKIVDADKVKQQ